MDAASLARHDRIRPIRWTGDALELLDQRKLPFAVEYARCTNSDEVATAILRRSKKNARLAANLQRYLSLASIEAAAERLADVPTRKLPEIARQTRARRKAEFDAWFEQQADLWSG